MRARRKDHPIVRDTPPDLGNLAPWHVVRHEEVASTQDALAEMLARFEVSSATRDRRVVVARRQSAGRGRAGARWESPDGGLWFSFSLLQNSPADPFLGFLVAEAALDSVQSGSRGTRTRGSRDPLPDHPRTLGLKWPNDLVMKGGKWGGLLAEVEETRCGGTLYRFGVGLNLDIAAESLPEGAGARITSIRVEFGSSPSPDDTLYRILRRFDELLRDDGTGGREASRKRIETKLRTIGRRIRWRERNGSIREGLAAREGMAMRLEPDGALRVRLADGSQTRLYASTIEHVRDTP